LQEEFSKYNNSFTIVLADFDEANAIESVLKQLVANGLEPSCVINNARNRENLEVGVDGVVAESKFMKEFLIDVIIPYQLTMGIHNMVESRLKYVVNVSSQYGVVAFNQNLYAKPDIETPIHYSVAKAALIHLTKELAVRLAPKGINVNCVSYGGIKGRTDTDFESRYTSLCPQQRMLTEVDVAGPIDSLISGKCDSIIGHNLIVDGGWSIW